VTQGFPDPQAFEPFPLARTERIYDSPWVGLRRDLIDLGGGREQEYHVIEISPAVCVVPVLAEGSIAMVWQLRHPHGRTHWEVPAGSIHADEEPLAAARRELLEETGLESERIERLAGFYPTNGISAHYAHAFLATNCERTSELRLDPAERLYPRAFTPEDVEAHLDAGAFADGFTAITLLYWLRSTR
jgi:ADP-ribose pyrophosphatase